MGSSSNIGIYVNHELLTMNVNMIIRGGGTREGGGGVYLFYKCWQYRMGFF